MSEKRYDGAWTEAAGNAEGAGRRPAEGAVISAGTERVAGS